MNTHSKANGNRAWRYSRPVLLGALVTLVVLVAMRVAATYVLQWYVNDKLDELPEYDGTIGDVDIHLIRGAYSIDDIDIVLAKVILPSDSGCVIVGTCFCCGEIDRNIATVRACKLCYHARWFIIGR